MVIPSLKNINNNQDTDTSLYPGRALFVYLDKTIRISINKATQRISSVLLFRLRSKIQLNSVTEGWMMHIWTFLESRPMMCECSLLHKHFMGVFHTTDHASLPLKSRNSFMSFYPNDLSGQNLKDNEFQ